MENALAKLLRVTSLGLDSSPLNLNYNCREVRKGMNDFNWDEVVNWLKENWMIVVIVVVALIVVFGMKGKKVTIKV